jgi:cytochrome P450
MTTTEEPRPTHGGCPVIHSDYRMDRPALSTYEALDAEREIAPILWNDALDHPFWVVQRHEDVKEICSRPNVFSSDIIQAVTPYGFMFLPNKLNPPDHARMRRVLNRWFTPSAMRRHETWVRSRAAELIAAIRVRGECDFVSEFAIQYPTELLLVLLGMPVEDGLMMVERVEDVFAGAFAGDRAATAIGSIKAYFADALAERRARPRDPEADFLTYLMDATIDGGPIPYEDQLTICMTLMVAGLHTTRGALGYTLRHLATHDDDRRDVVEHPELIPRVLEESVRLYNLIISLGRLVTEDVVFRGVRMSKGDIVWIGNVSACRDPRMFADPTAFDPHRDNLGKHLGWGHGEHRCLGMHLARWEMAIAVEEWHRQIPEYEIAPDATLTEGGVQLGLRQLPLRWSVARP